MVFWGKFTGSSATRVLQWKDSALSLPGARIQFPVGKLRFCKMCSAAKKKKKISGFSSWTNKCNLDKLGNVLWAFSFKYVLCFKFGKPLHTHLCIHRKYLTLFYVLLVFSCKGCQTPSVALQRAFFPYNDVSLRPFHIGPQRSILFCKMRIITSPYG